jgi:hypothetical protein
MAPPARASGVNSLGGTAAAALAAADAACMSDANKPSGGGIYKALLASSVRRACTSANCGSSGIGENLGWVLKPSADYYRADGTTKIGTTTAAAVFAFPLDESINTNSANVMTGLSNV